jgi:hypothetical protein
MQFNMVRRKYELPHNCTEIFTCIFSHLYLQILRPAMSQFAFTNDLKNCVKMDEPMTKGPIPPWQKKCIEASNLRFVLCNATNCSNGRGARIVIQKVHI